MLDSIMYRPVECDPTPSPPSPLSLRSSSLSSSHLSSSFSLALSWFFLVSLLLSYSKYLPINSFICLYRLSGFLKNVQTSVSILTPLYKQRLTLTIDIRPATSFVIIIKPFAFALFQPTPSLPLTSNLLFNSRRTLLITILNNLYSTLQWSNTMFSSFLNVMQCPPFDSYCSPLWTMEKQWRKKKAMINQWSYLYLIGSSKIAEKTTASAASGAASWTADAGSTRATGSTGRTTGPGGWTRRRRRSPRDRRLVRGRNASPSDERYEAQRIQRVHESKNGWEFRFWITFLSVCLDLFLILEIHLIRFI